MLDTRHKLCTFILKNPPGETFFFLCGESRKGNCSQNPKTDLLMKTFVFPNTESNDSGSASVKKEKEKKNRKKDKENGSGSGEAGNHDNFDAPEAVVRLLCSQTPAGLLQPWDTSTKRFSSLHTRFSQTPLKSVVVSKVPAFILDTNATQSSGF